MVPKDKLKCWEKGGFFECFWSPEQAKEPWILMSLGLELCPQTAKIQDILKDVKQFHASKNATLN